MKEEVLTNFIKNVENHQMEILQDEGVDRHLKFSNNNSLYFAFQIITKEGILIIDGDCGTFVFKRINDMFNFFGMNKDEDGLPINPSYWAEKCVDGGSNRCFEFSSDRSRKSVRDYLDDSVESDDFDLGEGQTKEDYIENFMYCVTSDEGDVRFYDSLYNLDIPDPSDFICEDPTYHYTWCLYAIVWGIKQYDNFKNPNPNS